MKTKYIFLNPEGVIRLGRNGQGWNPKCVENLCIVIGTTGAFVCKCGMAIAVIQTESSVKKPSNLYNED